MFRHSLRRYAAPFLTLALLLSGFLFAPAAGAQTLAGSVYDGNGGPLLTGQTYTVTSSITVPAGETLTVQAGVAVKFAGNTQATILGTLVASGSVSSPIIMTSIEDNLALGTGTAEPGDWRGLIFSSSSDASTLDHVDIRFTGRAGFSALEITSADITVDSCSVSDAAAAAVDLNATAARPSVSNCSFSDNAGVAIDRVQLEAVPGFSNNVAFGNGQDAINVTSGVQLTQDLTITTDNLIDDVLYVAVNQLVPAGVTLTLEPGVIVKMEDNTQVTLNGTLIAGGTDGNEVVFTAARDDSMGGDSDGGGSSVGVAGDWRGLIFSSPSDASTLDHVDIRFTGRAGFSALEISSADITVDSCSVSNAAAAAVDLNATAARPSVSNCSFSDNAGVAIDRVQLEAVPGFSNNVASGNGQDVINVTSGAQLTQDITITTDNLIDDVLYVAVNQLVPAGVTLTLDAGVIVKMEDNMQVTLNGTLLANGTEGDAVVFTAARDDGLGGDSDGGGSSVGVAGDWRGLIFNVSSTASVLTHVHTAFTGAAGFPAIDINSGDPTLISCEIRDGSASGVDLNLAAVRPTITQCVFLRLGGPPIDKCQLESVAGFDGNVASDGVQDVVLVGTGIAITQDITITTDNLIDDVLFLTSSHFVPIGTTLTLDSGMIVKMPFNGQFVVDGGLVVEGESDKRVVFTSTVDDATGGDSNGDGALSTPAPGDWRGLVINAIASGPVSLCYATVQFTGSAGFAGIRNSSGLATMRAVRVEHTAAEGFRLGNLMGELLDCVAFRCGSHGFLLDSGAFDVRGCDAVDNVGTGFLAIGWTGDVRNSVSWDNASAPFGGIVASDVFFSNGEASFVGVNENRNVNPDFVNQAEGDLRLAVGSGLIDAGAFPIFPSGKDAGGFSRDLDGLLDGVRRVDIGAHEFSNIELDVLGAPIAGGLVTVQVSGTPGLVNTNLIVGLGEIEASFKRFGNLFVDIGGIHVILPWLSAPSAVPLSLPVELPVGLEIQLQAITFTGPVPSMAAGNLSNPVTLTVE